MSAAEPIDWLVVTASNESQARGYRAQLSARARDGRLRGVGRWRVTPDPPKGRIGSGGSTLRVLQSLARSLGGTFEGQRILVIHSGGESRRLPAFAAQGKVFVPVPDPVRAGIPVPLFDLLLRDLRGLVSGSPGRVLVATGDVYLGVAGQAIDLTGHEVVGVAFPGDTARASRHGVYVLDDAGAVRRVLQKPTKARAREAGAVGRDGRVQIDTGLVSIGARTAKRWVEWYAMAERHGPLDLYADMLPALASAAEGATQGALEGLGRGSLGVQVVPTCAFLHIGTSRELVDAWAATPGRRLTLDSVVRNQGQGIPPGCVVEGCDLGASIGLTGSNVLVGLPPTRVGVRLPKGMGLAALPVGRARWACVAFGVDDDLKTPLEQGGTFGGRSLAALARRIGDAALLWPDASGERTLWTARLWSVGTIDRVLRDLQWLLEVRGAPPPRWASRPRMSLGELLASGQIDHRRFLSHRAALRRRSLGESVVVRALEQMDRPSAEFAAETRVKGERARAIAQIESVAPRMPPLERSRLLWVARDLSIGDGRRGGLRRATALEARAFDAVANAVMAERSPVEAMRSWAIAEGERVLVESPLRIDLAGGWSDTPPICQERGGSVVNAAITLDGVRPIRVTGRLLREPVLRIVSEDQARTLTLGTSKALTQPLVPSDWSSLARAGVVLAGVGAPGRSLRSQLERLGGGLELSLRSDAPKGSGLGASSILGASLLACLDRLTGRDYSPERTIARTLVLEQMMGTGGGWQDQAGGVTPGFKIVRTSPGQVQRSVIEPIDASRLVKVLGGRMMLYFTGYQRLAADVLRGVVARYLAREPAMLRTIDRLKAGAERIRDDLTRGDAEAFAAGVAEYWRLKRAIDPGATTPAIERLVRPISRDLSAYLLPGAGGGGFLFMIAKNEQAAHRVRRQLTERAPKGSARFFDFAFDQVGLESNVLRPT